MKNIKKFLCVALAAVMTIAIIPANSTKAATYSELQAKRKNLAASTSNAKKEIEKLKNNEELKILFYGDSITTGVNSSSAVDVAPHADTWMEMVTKILKKTYKNGKTVEIEKTRTKYKGIVKVLT